MPYMAECLFCGALMRFRRPPGYQTFCSLECVMAEESDLRKRVNAVPLPRQLREE